MSALHQQQYDIENDDYDLEENEAEDRITEFPANESFDVSSFTQSKSGPQMLSRNIKEVFPISNAPTLQVSPQPKLNFSSKNRFQKFKFEDFKSSNQISGRSKIGICDNELQNLRMQIKQKQKNQQELVQKISELNNANLQLEKVIRSKDMIIREKEELLLQQQKKYKEALQYSAKSAQQSTKEKSRVQGSYADQFCPELLSPEQTLELFSQLVLKMDKSINMKKKVLKDRKVVGILSQLLKIQ